LNKANADLRHPSYASWDLPRPRKRHPATAATRKRAPSSAVKRRPRAANRSTKPFSRHSSGAAPFSFLSASGRFAIAQGRAATLVQVTGGSARRALPGRGLWAAGSFGVRAITNAAALELRPRGIQVTLLVVDAGIQPLDGSARGGVSPEALADPRRIADAVLFLANQDARSATHELQLTPLAENWTP